MDKTTLDLVVEALRARADQRVAAAQKGAQVVAARKETGRDVRSNSVTLVLELAAAQTLTDIAAGLDSGSLQIHDATEQAEETTDGTAAEPTAPEQPAGTVDDTVDGGIDGPINDDAVEEVLAGLETPDE